MVKACAVQVVEAVGVEVQPETRREPKGYAFARMVVSPLLGGGYEQLAEYEPIPTGARKALPPAGSTVRVPGAQVNARPAASEASEDDIMVQSWIAGMVARVECGGAGRPAVDTDDSVLANFRL